MVPEGDAMTKKVRITVRADNTAESPGLLAKATCCCTTHIAWASHATWEPKSNSTHQHLHPF